MLSATLEFGVGVLLAFGLFHALGGSSAPRGAWWFVCSLPILVSGAIALVHRLLGRRVSSVAIVIALAFSVLVGGLGFLLTAHDADILGTLIFYVDWELPQVVWALSLGVWVSFGATAAFSVVSALYEDFLRERGASA